MALTLEVLGALVRQVQADMRAIRTDIAALRDEVATDRGATVRAVADLLRASEGLIMDRLAALEAIVQHRGDQA